MRHFTVTVLLVLFSTLAFAQPASVDAAVASEFSYSQGLGVTNVSRSGKYGVVVAVINSAPAAGVFTCAVTDICTKTAHGYTTGLKIQASTVTTLPAGLAAITDYFVIYLTVNTFKLAASLVDAQAGTPVIDITDVGVGDHTVTPTTLAGASLKLQGSMNNSTWVDLPIKASGDLTKSSSITATANFYLAETDLAVNYVRVYFTLTAGQLSISQISKVRP